MSRSWPGRLYEAGVPDVPRPVQADITSMTQHVECVAILEPARKSR
ncbi:hypothetical protein ACH5A2_36410 [Streptomyces collinus]